MYVCMCIYTHAVSPGCPRDTFSLRVSRTFESPLYTMLIFIYVCVRVCMYRFTFTHMTFVQVSGVSLESPVFTMELCAEGDLFHILKNRYVISYACSLNQYG